MYSRLSPSLRGMLMMFVASVSAVLMHATVRHLSAELPPFEMAFFRNFLALAFLLPMLLREGLQPLRTKKWRLHLLRGALTTVSMLSFFTALSLSPLAQITALSFTAPLFATLLAIVFLGEIVRVRRWIAIICGFAGTLIILRPGLVEIDLGAFLALFAAGCWGAAIAMTRVLGRTESSLTITLYMAFVMAPLSLIPATFVWTWPSWYQLAWLLLIAGFGTLTQLCFSQSLREAETSVVMPIDFFKLIWASLLGYVLFAERPDLFTWIGGGLIFASATYIAYRESKLKKAVIAYNKDE